MAKQKMPETGIPGEVKETGGESRDRAIIAK
jgi:hypothetical protein